MRDSNPRPLGSQPNALPLRQCPKNSIASPRKGRVSPFGGCRRWGSSRRPGPHRACSASVAPEGAGVPLRGMPEVGVEPTRHRILSTAALPVCVLRRAGREGLEPPLSRSVAERSSAEPTPHFDELSSARRRTVSSPGGGGRTRTHTILNRAAFPVCVLRDEGPMAPLACSKATSAPRRAPPRFICAGSQARGLALYPRERATYVASPDAARGRDPAPGGTARSTSKRASKRTSLVLLGPHPALHIE